MKPIAELQAEIAERKTILSTLPPAVPGLLGWIGEPPTSEQLAHRAELETEIGLLESEIHRQTVVAPIFNEGMKFERGRHQTNAANKKHSPNHEARVHCRSEARQLWAANDDVIRVGEMVQLLADDLRGKGMFCPKSPDTIAGWLKADDKAGLLSIPPEARKGGRPKK